MLFEGGVVVRWWRLARPVLTGVGCAVAVTVLAVASNVATGGSANVFSPIEQHPLRWTIGTALYLVVTAAVAAALLLVWAAERVFERGRGRHQRRRRRSPSPPG
jgi:hypothetical protein